MAPLEPARWDVVIDAVRTPVVFEPSQARLVDPGLLATPGGQVVSAAPVIVLGHGAGGHMDHRTTTMLAATLRAAGLHTVRFNFLYRAAGHGPPDAMPRLMACFRATVESLRMRLQPERLLIGGHSLGGRVASMLAADGFACDGLLLLAYPLHPAGQPERLRKTHLPQITQPVLCLSGTRDALCQRELMENVLGPLSSNWTMHWLKGADHSFHVLKRSGRTDADVLDEVRATAQSWLTRLTH